MRKASPPPEDRPHVLVVDDEPTIRELLTTLLRRQGYRLSTAGRAAEAREVLAEQSVDLLVTDLKMPDEDGLALIRAARDLQPDLAAILITGHATTETAVAALRDGADDFITKPFEIEALRRTVERVLASRRMLQREQETLRRTRDEASSLRDRTRRAEAALVDARRDLLASRRDLERRVRDLAFVQELTTLLAGEEDLQRMLETSARILGARLGAEATRIEVATDGAAHAAEARRAAAPPGLLARHLPDLVARPRATGSFVTEDVLLGLGRPRQLLGVSLEAGGSPVGGLALLREVPEDEDAASDREVLDLVPRALAVGIEAERQRRAAREGGLAVAHALLETLEGRGVVPRGHAERVARLSRALAEALDLSPRLAGVVETAARLHDVGAVGAPDGVLQRPGPLTEAEREIVRRQPVLGARLLAPFGETAAYVRHHREHVDGTGYPDGLHGDDIPIGAAIIAVAEAYDAITHARPHRPSRSREAAREELRAERGRHFEPRVVDALLALPEGTA